MRALLITPGLMLAASLTACDTLFPIACTDIGCPDGLTVELSAPVVGEYTIEIEMPDGTVHTWRDTPANGVARGFFPVRADELVVRVTTSAGSIEHTVQPEYEGLFPNGRRCDRRPVCHQARLVLDPPG